MLHSNFAADFDFTDEELLVLKTARKVKMGHLFGDQAVATHANRPKGNCTKTRFRSRKDALDAVRSIKYDQFRLLAPEDRDAKLPRRAYRCHECRNGYHLTSKIWAPFRQPANVIQLFALSQQIQLSELADVA